jgi:acyl-coenzyme A synthetase/AMP-(fatty) acid ligase
MACADDDESEHSSRAPASLVGRLEAHALREGRAPAVAGHDLRLTVAELLVRVRERAEHLARFGVVSASTVGIACADEVEHLVLCLAVAALGATSCAVAGHAGSEERAGLLARAGVHVVAGAAGDVATVGEPGDTAGGAGFLFATSGTTGDAKLVRLSDCALVAQAHRHVKPHERFACRASIEHNFARRHRLYAVAHGATNVFLRPSAEVLVEELLGLEATTLHLSAYQARELLAVPRVAELAGLCLKLGGSHVPLDLRRALRTAVTAALQCGYGTTETGAIAFTDPDDADAGESVGRPLPGIEVRVLDASCEPAPAGARGELAVRCAGLFEGYVGRPDLTAERITEGWFRTGDLGAIDAAGRLHLAGRSDDMFVFNSMNIHPQELEAELGEHPAVLDCAVLPWPSAVHGDVPVALVVLAPETAPDLGELKRFARERLGLRAPRRFTTVTAIPRNAAGKILRADARALLEGAESA